MNAELDKYKQDNWLANSMRRGYISGLKTIHVFMVSDVCFSGDILNANRTMPPAIDNTYSRVNRLVLTSGSSETVPDESEFSQALKMSLRKNSAPLLDPYTIFPAALPLSGIRHFWVAAGFPLRAAKPYGSALEAEVFYRGSFWN